MLVPGTGKYLALLFCYDFRNVDKYRPNVDLFWWFYILYLSLSWFRIVGNAEERPMNVRPTLRQRRRRGLILIAAFLFIITC